MQAFAASLQNELFKLRKRKKYLVLLIIASAICVVSALRVLIVNYLTDGGVSREAILGGLMSSNMPFVLLIFLPLMAIMAAGDLYVGEQVDHTIRFSLMRPVGKAKLFFSKAAAVWVLCAFDLAVLYLVSTLSQVCLGGGIEGIFSSFFACVLDLIPMAVLILFFALINQLVKGSSLTVLLCGPGGVWDLYAVRGRPGLYRLSALAQPVDRRDAALPVSAAADRPAGGLWPGLWLRRLSAV